VLAVLLSPPVAAYAAATYAGTGLSMRAIKLSARQVAALPLPADREAWAEAAQFAERAQSAPGERLELLAKMGGLMCEAYDVTDRSVFGWWLDRLSRRR
jgi:hypothetical protein